MNSPLLPALRDIEILFRPFIHRKLPLRGRIVLTPLNTLGAPHQQMAQYYRAHAEHHPALIITEGLAIDDSAAPASATAPGLNSGRDMRAWKSICRAVHAADCKIAAQIYHAGMARETSQFSDSVVSVGPSGISPFNLQQMTAPMNRQRMDEVKAAFARTATIAKALGFDAIEIQGAGGFIIEQFLWQETNKRLDEYGGTVPGRVRYACEVVHSVRKAVGRNFPIIFRLAQWEPRHEEARLVNTAHELEQLLSPLSDAGVDIFHCSSLHHDRPALEGNPLTFAAWVRLITGKPTICDEGIHTTLSDNSPSAAHIQHLLNRLHAGAIDLISIQHVLHNTPSILDEWRYGK